MPPRTTAAPNSHRRAVPRGIDRNGIAFLSYGFRPFFFGALFWAVATMLLWLSFIIWSVDIGAGYGSVNWHAHEMLFGYTSAVLAGFMLTAIPNWTGRLPVSGMPLLLIFLLWLAGRLVMTMPSLMGVYLAISIESLFFPALGFIAAREIWVGRNWKNLHVVFALSLLTIANIWFHWSVIERVDTGFAYRLTVMVWVVLISFVGGKLIVSFTNSWLSKKGQVKRPVSFGQFDKITIGLTAVALGVWVVIPSNPTTGIFCVFAAVLNFCRLARWRGLSVMSEPLQFVLHIAYAFIVLGLTVIAASTFGLIGSVSALHLMTVGVIGNMTLAVMVHSSLRHTGRKQSASFVTTLGFGALILAAFTRPLAELYAAFYDQLLISSGVFWLIAFGAITIEFAPILLLPRQTTPKL